MSNAPTRADIGYPVTVMWATADVGPARDLASVRWFVVHTTEGRRVSDLDILVHADQAQASAHAWIGQDGELVMIVPLERTAWTVANQAVDVQAVNVELDGFSREDRSEAQYRATAAFYRWCVGQGMTGVPAEYVGRDERPGIIGHKDVANPSRPGAWGGVSGHTDPGPLFRWEYLIACIKAGPAHVDDPNAYRDPLTGFWVVNQPGVALLAWWRDNGGVERLGRPLAGMTRRADGVYEQLFENVLLECYPDGWGLYSGPYIRLGGLGQRYRTLLAAPK